MLDSSERTRVPNPFVQTGSSPLRVLGKLAQTATREVDHPPTEPNGSRPARADYRSEPGTEYVIARDNPLLRVSGKLNPSVGTHRLLAGHRSVISRKR